MLIVQAKSQPYRGRFTEKAVELLGSGVRVGRMYVSGCNPCHCHVCEAEFDPPSKQPGHRDAWGECSTCKTPFVFEFVQ